MGSRTWILAALMSISVSTVSSLNNCTLTPVNNATFVDKVYPYFSSDSEVKVLEYTLSFSNVSRTFSLDGQSSKFAFHPHRWYRTQGTGNYQLLLINHFYYGLLKPLLVASIGNINVQLQVSPRDCLDNATGDQLQEVIKDYLLQNFYIDEKTVKNPFKYSEEVEICTANIVDNDGWGKLVYRCCGYNDEKIQTCRNVQEDDWVWALQAVIISLTIILFLYFPILLPSGYRIYTYTYTPKENLTFRFIKTKTPQRYRKFGNDVSTSEIQPVILTFRQWNKMKVFGEQINQQGYAEDIAYTASVKRINLNVCMDRLIIEGGSAVSALRSLFDAFIRCKVRRSDPFRECCYAPACGEHCFETCPPWKSWLKAVRTIAVMVILAGPSIPFFYAISAEHLSFQELDRTYETLGLAKKFNFYVGPVFGKLIVAILGFLYVIHIVIIVVDGATDENMSKLYTELLDIAEKKDRITERSQKHQSIISRACRPIKKCGILIIPFYLLGVVLAPLIAIVLIVMRAPMIRLITQGVAKLLRRLQVLKRQREDVFMVYNACEIFWFFFSAIGVFVVLTIGANFLVNLLVVAIVTVIVEADLLYRVVPVALVLVLYVRDSYSQVGIKYDNFFGKVIGTLRSKVDEKLRNQALKREQDQRSKIYKIPFDPVGTDEGPEKNNETQKFINGNANINMSKQKMIKAFSSANIFSVKNSSPRLRLEQLLLFFSKDDFLYLSKKFLFECSTMNCAEAPGVLEKNYIDATLQFAKIGIFLLFVFLVVMAYGTTYYISPTNHLFVTLVSGLVPLIIRNVFSGGPSRSQESSSNYRFDAQLNEKIKSFSQSWDIDDMQLNVRLQPLTKKREISSRRSIGGSVDLILDLNAAPGDFDALVKQNSVQPSSTDDDPINVGDFGDNAVDMKDEDGANKASGKSRAPRRGAYSHEGHAAGVARAEEAHRRDVLAHIDTHLVTDTLMRTFGLIPESDEGGAASRERSRRGSHEEENEKERNGVSRPAITGAIPSRIDNMGSVARDKLEEV